MHKTVDITLVPAGLLCKEFCDNLPAACNGQCNGDATVSATGGTAPYTYLWDDPASQVTSTATGLCQDTFNVTVTDLNGCTNISGTTVSEPAVLTTSILVNSNASCNGICDATAIGGTPPYTYLWDAPQLPK